jgi:chromosome segregation ATPase
MLSRSEIETAKNVWEKSRESCARRVQSYEKSLALLDTIEIMEIDIGNLLKENTQLREQLTSDNNGIREQAREIAKLQTKLANLQSSTQYEKAAKADIWKEKYEEAEKTIEQLKQQVEAYDQMKYQLNTQTNEVARWKVLNDQLRTTMAVRIEDLERQVTNWKSHYENIINKFTDLQETHQSILSSYRESMGELRRQIDSEKLANSTLFGQFTTAESLLREKVTENDSLREKMAALEKQLSSIRELFNM